MGILEDFYNGNIHPYRAKYNPESKQSKAAARFEEVSIELEKALPENKHELLKEMFDNGVDMCWENGKENFVRGFITGMRFGAECFYRKED